MGLIPGQGTKIPPGATKPQPPQGRPSVAIKKKKERLLGLDKGETRKAPGVNMNLNECLLRFCTGGVSI